jgi:hypothetical protein
MTGEVDEGDERGSESYDRKKAWSSINHSILSEFPLRANSRNKVTKEVLLELLSKQILLILL